MFDSVDILVFLFAMPVVMVAYFIGNIIDNAKINNTKNGEWTDRRPLSCQWNMHSMFRDSQYKRHCLKCEERQTFIAGVGFAGWSVDSRPMIDLNS